VRHSAKTQVQILELVSANIIVQILDNCQVNYSDPKPDQAQQPQKISASHSSGQNHPQFRVRFLVVLRQHYSANP